MGFSKPNVGASRVRCLAGIAVLAVARFGGGQAADGGTRPQLLVQTGLGSINSLTFAPSGGLLIAGNDSGEAVLVDLAQRKSLRRFRHPAAVTDAAWTPDGGRVATACVDGVVRLWDIRTGAELRRFAGHEGAVNDVAVSRDGASLFSGGEDKTLRMWDIATGREVRRMEYEFPVSALAASPDGKTLAVGLDNWARFMGERAMGAMNGSAAAAKDSPLPVGSLVDTSTWREVSKLMSAQPSVRQLAFTKNGKLVGAATRFGLELWDPASGKNLGDANQPGANSISFSPDTRTMLVGGADGLVVLWDTAPGGSSRQLTNDKGYSIHAELAPDGALAVTGSADGVLHIWDSASRAELYQMRGAPYVAKVELSRDGRLARSWYEKWRVTWNLASGAGVLENRGPGDFGAKDDKPPAGAGSAAGLASDGPLTSADRRLTATEDEEGAVVVKEAASGRVLQRLRVAREGTNDDWIRLSEMAFLDGGKKLLTMHDINDVYFRVWDIATGKQVLEFGPHCYGFDGSSISPDGKRIAIAMNYDSPDGGHGSPEQRTASVWDLETGAEALRLARTGDPVDSVEYGRDGSEIFLGKGDGTVAAYDARTGAKRRTFGRHDGAVTSLAISPDGRILITGGSDSTVRFYDAASGAELASTTATAESWIVTDPSGRFDTNDVDNMPSLAWIAPDDPLRALAPEIFMRQYYTPRLLARVLLGERLPELPQLGSLNRAQPKVEIADVRLGAAGDVAGVSVSVEQTTYLQRVSGARDLRLFRDGQLVGYREGPIALDKNGRATVEFPGIKLPMDKKNVEYSAYAFNSDRVKGMVGSKTLALPERAARKPRAYILAIGVDRMPAMPELALRFAAADAERLSAVLQATLEAGGRFDRVEAAVLESSVQHPNGASKPAIRAKIAEIARAAWPEDFVLVAFSGHGYAEAGGMFHILPSDIAPGAGALPRGTISTAELTDWLRPVDARDVALVLDSCQSAASVEANGFRPGPMGDPGLGQLAYDKRMRILAATQVADAAVESDRLREGLLTYSLVQEGLKDGKADWQPKDGRIGLSEWLSYGVRRVPELYGELKSGKLRGVTPVARGSEAQTPSLYDFTKPAQALWLR